VVESVAPMEARACHTMGRLRARRRTAKSRAYQDLLNRFWS
jgi:hypothetical protein